MRRHAGLPEIPGCGLVVWRLDGTIVRASSTFWSLLGRDGSGPVGYWQLTAPGQRQREVNLLLTGEGAFEKEFLHADGRAVTARVLGGSLDDGGERLLFAYVDGRLGASSDKAMIEQALRHQNGILLELTRADALDSGDIDRAVALVTEAGAQGLGCARSSVWLYAEGEAKIECLDLFEQDRGQHSRGAELTARDFPRYFEALSEDRTIAADDAHTHPATSEFSSVYLAPLGITSMLEAPIRSRGKLVGVLCSEHIGPRRTFSQQEQNFAASVADAFGRSLQAAERRRYETALREANDRLESTVRARTASLQMALDSMGDGLLVCEPGGAPTGDRSRAVEEWFGPLAPGLPVWDYIAGGDERVRDALASSFEAMADGFLPFEVLAAQAPPRLERDGRTFSMSYRAITHGPQGDRIVLLIRDITADLAAERAQALARELADVVGHLVRDRDTFVAFVEETEALLRRLTSPASDREVRLRSLHTLKGNTATFGFASFAAACHELEDRLREGVEGRAEHEAIARLEAHWRDSMVPLSALFGPGGRASVRLLDDEYQSFLDRLEQGADHDELIELARRWRHELIGSLLAPYATRAARLARSLDKKVSVHIDDHGERLPRASLRPLFTELVHCVNNALDHGLEPPAERIAAGKPEEGTLRFDARRQEGELVVTISDDGRGIDWDAVRAKAAARGLPAETEQDLMDALLSDGFSTHTEVTPVSGRGVGLGAAASACRALGGRFVLESRRGAGTHVVFAIPLERP